MYTQNKHLVVRVGPINYIVVLEAYDYKIHNLADISHSGCYASNYHVHM